MLVPTKCPECETTYLVDEETVGKEDKCESCGLMIKIIAESRIVSEGDQVEMSAASTVEDGKALPEAFGRYKVLAKLGEGSFGVVYLAYDDELKREVAIKVPQKGYERFLREARILSKFHHANFCVIFDVGVDKDVPFLVMKYIKGETLKDRMIRNPPRDFREASKLIQSLAIALSAAHKEKVIHRDLKPANIMIDSHGQLFLMDFGLAREIDAKDPRLSMPGTLMGTPAYMPPEQARGLVNEIDERSDIYSLGAIFYELLTGRLPFEGKSPMEILSQVIGTDKAIPPSKINRSTDRRLDDIVLKAIAKDSAQRFASMDEFSAALVTVLSVEAVPEDGKPARRRPPFRVMAVTSFAGVAVLAGLFYLPRVLRPVAQSKQETTSNESGRKQETAPDGPRLNPGHVHEVRLANGGLPDPEKLEIQLGTDGDPRPIRILRSGLKARELPEDIGADNHEIGDHLGYLEPSMTVMEHEPAGGGGKYYLLAKTAKAGGAYQVRQVLGWVQSKYLLTTEHALQEPVTKLYQKAVVVNSIDNIAEDLKRAQASPDTRSGGITPRTAPSTTGPATIEEIPGLNLFFVYGRADGHTLLGRSPIMPTDFGEQDQAKKILVGWVPNERVCEWHTREAVYWNPGPSRERPGVVFKTPQDALQALKGGTGAVVISEVSNDPARQVFGRKPGAMEMRFPVFEWDGDRNTPRRFGDNEMIRVGAFGDFKTGGVAGQVREARFFQPGYVWVNNAKGVEQIRRYVLLNEAEISRFLEITNGLDRMPDEVGYLTVAELLKRLVGLEVGELDQDMTAAEALQKYTGFKINQPGFYSKLKDLNKATLSPQERADIAWKRSILSDILKSEKWEYMIQQVSPEGGSERVEHFKTAKKPLIEPRGFSFPGDPRIRWYWIDFEEEWP